MFNATYFTYNGKWSGEYGLIIADFKNDSVEELDAFSMNLSTLKVPHSINFIHGGIEYDSAPVREFSIVSELEFTDDQRREILSWLLGANQFKPLMFDDGSPEPYTYSCVFTAAKTIFVNGRCHGFRLTAVLDSPYAKGTPTVVSGTQATTSLYIVNYSDIKEYVYPTVKFTGGGIDIVNETDDVLRHFTFDNLDTSESVTVDNEKKIITSSLGGEKLSNFTSKKWLRLRPGRNKLNIVARGIFTITCPYYAMLGS